MAVCAPFAPRKEKRLFSLTDDGLQMLGGILCDCLPQEGYVSKPDVGMALHWRMSTLYEHQQFQGCAFDDVRPQVWDMWFDMVQHFFEHEHNSAARVYAFAQNLKDGTFDQPALREILAEHAAAKRARR
jgi:hypothetical protein